VKWVVILQKRHTQNGQFEFSIHEHGNTLLIPRRPPGLDVDKADGWSGKWLLKYNKEKCHVLSVKNKFEEAKYTMESGDGNNIVLQHTYNEKDIGVHMDPNLNFDEHINAKVNKANSNMGIIRRSFKTLDAEIFPYLFKAMVRPHLEYASSVWNPYLKRQVKLIEDVQRRATKLLPGMDEKSYEERLQDLKLPTLVYRRARGDMIETYKIMSDKYDDSLPKFLELAGNTHGTRGHKYKLRHNNSRLNVRKHFFTNRIVTMWNDLPGSIVEAKNVQTFEARLDRFWSNQEFKYIWTSGYRSHDGKIIENQLNDPPEEA